MKKFLTVLGAISIFLTLLLGYLHLAIKWGLPGKYFATYISSIAEILVGGTIVVLFFSISFILCIVLTLINEKDEKNKNS